MKKLQGFVRRGRHTVWTYCHDADGNVAHCLVSFETTQSSAQVLKTSRDLSVFRVKSKSDRCELDQC